MHHHRLIILLVFLIVSAIVALTPGLRQIFIDYYVALRRRFGPLSVSPAEVRSFMPRVLKALSDRSSLALSQDSAGTVAFEGFNDCYRAIFQPLVAAILAPEVGACRVKNCNGIAQSAPADAAFHILVYSAASGVAQCLAPARYQRDDTETMFAPTGLGVPLIDDAGFIVAELVDNCLYVLVNPFVNGNLSEAQSFGEVLLKAKEALRQLKSAESDSLRFETVAAAPALGRFCDTGYVDRQREQLRSLHRQQHELLSYEAAGNGAPEREFEQICRNSKVLSVKVTYRAIIVRTDVLYCDSSYNSQLYEIGAFRIRIPFSPRGNVSWRNTTRLVRAYYERRFHAPHVPFFHKPCLGSAKHTFPKLIRDRQFAAAVDLAIAFVQSANENDPWGRHVVDWPIAHVRHKTKYRATSYTYLLPVSCREKLRDIRFSEDGNYLVVEGQELQAALIAIGSDAYEDGTDRGRVVLKLTTPKQKPAVVAIAGARERYLRACRGREEGASEELVRQIHASTVTLRSYEEQLFWQIRDQFCRESSDDERAANAKEQWQRLTQHRKIERVRVVNGTILIDTKTLFGKSRKTKELHELGAFTIAIGANSGKFGVRWFNRTRRSPLIGMNAANVFADGTPVCEEVLATLLELGARCEFGDVANLAIQFVEAVSETSAGYLDGWPKAQEVKVHANA
ncbi:MAG TPA: hypothetical protein V6C81_13020 [Planktothrix sp.]